MREIYTAYSTVGAQELLEKGYRVRRHSWNKNCYLEKIFGDISTPMYFSVSEDLNLKVNVTDCMDMIWDFALEDGKGDIAWEIY